MIHETISTEEWEKFPVRKRERAPKARNIVASLICDTISDEGRRHCYLMDKQVTGRQLKYISSKIGGDVWGREDYFSHSSGNTSEIYVYKGVWADYARTREMAQELLGIEDVGWTPAQCAIKIDKWLGFYENKIDPCLVKEYLPTYSFYAVSPCKLPMAYEHDMSSAFWQIVKMAPTPRIKLYHGVPGVLTYKSMDPDRRDKWEKMLKVIEPHKGARLAIVGNWVGEYGLRKWRYKSIWHFRDGQPVLQNYKRPSRLSTFGLLVVRLVYELCQEEYLTDNGFYGWVDCVMTESKVANYWRDIGIPYTIKGSGPTWLCRSDLYRIGSRSVGVWLDTSRFIPPRVPLKPVLLDRATYFHPRLLKDWDYKPQPESIEELPQVKHQIELPPYTLKLPLGPPPPPNPPPQTSIDLF